MELCSLSCLKSNRNRRDISVNSHCYLCEDSCLVINFHRAFIPL